MDTYRKCSVNLLFYLEVNWYFKFDADGEEEKR